MHYVHAMHRAGERARIYKSYVRCIQEELARDAPRCATAEKARAAWEHSWIRTYVHMHEKMGKRRARVSACTCMHMRARVRTVGRVNGTRTHINAEAGKRVYARVESNVRTSPLDFVDGISTWIDYLAIDVCRKRGEYACRGALGQARFLLSSFEGEYM